MIAERSEQHLWIHSFFCWFGRGWKHQEKNNNTLKRTEWGESKRTMEHLHICLMISMSSASCSWAGWTSRLGWESLDSTCFFWRRLWTPDGMDSTVIPPIWEGFRCHRGRDWWHSQECVLPRIFQPGLFCPGLDHYSGAWTSWEKIVSWRAVCWLVPKDGGSSCWCLQRLGAKMLFAQKLPHINTAIGQQLPLQTVIVDKCYVLQSGSALCLWCMDGNIVRLPAENQRSKSHTRYRSQNIKCSRHFWTCSIAFVAKPVKDFHGLSVCQSIRSQPAVVFFLETRLKHSNFCSYMTLLTFLAKWQNLKVVSQLFPTQWSCIKAWCFAMILCLSEMLPVIWVIPIWGLNHECQSGVVTKIAAPVDISDLLPKPDFQRASHVICWGAFEWVRMIYQWILRWPQLAMRQEICRTGRKPRNWHSHVTSCDCTPCSGKGFVVGSRKMIFAPWN